MMNQVIDAWMPMDPPRTTHQEKKVSCKNGKPVFYEDEELKDARNKLMANLARHRPKEKIKGATILSVLWLYRTKDKRKNGKLKTTKPDTDNIDKLLKDCMTDLKFWRDDAQVAIEYIEKRWTTETPGIRIRVEEVDQ